MCEVWENYIKDIDDTSDWTGEEDFDEFMEHEDYEWLF